MKITRNTNLDDFEKYLLVMNGKLGYTFKNMSHNENTEIDNKLIACLIDGFIGTFIKADIDSIRNFINSNNERFLNVIVSKRNKTFIDDTYVFIKNEFLKGDYSYSDILDLFYTEIEKEVEREKSCKNTISIMNSTHIYLKKYAKEKNTSLIGVIDIIKDEILSGAYDDLIQDNTKDKKINISVKRETSNEIKEYLKEKNVNTLQAIEIIVNHKINNQD